jgi:hypothetical protein
MRTLSVLLILISCLSPGYSQHLNPDDFNAQVPQRFNLSLYNAADLFDSCEIKDRKIKSAALLKVYDNSCFTDTLFVYYFDSTGKAIMQVSFTPPDTSAEGDSYVRDNITDLNEVKVIPEEKDIYTTISFNPYGVEKNYYKKSTDELLDSQFIFSRNYGVACVQTNGRAEMITYPIEEGSALIGKIVSINMDADYYSSQYLIRYLDN